MSTKTQIKKFLIEHGWKEINYNIMRKYVNGNKYWCYFYKKDGIHYMDFQKRNKMIIKNSLISEDEPEKDIVINYWEILASDLCKNIKIEDNRIEIKGHIISYIP